MAFNRTVSKVEDFMKNEAKGTNVIGATSLENMVSLLKKPRRVMLLVKAGSAVDAFIDKLVSMSVPSIFPFVFSVIRLIDPWQLPQTQRKLLSGILISMKSFFLLFFSVILILESYFQMIGKTNLHYTYRFSNIVDRVTSNQIFIIINYDY